MTTSHFTFFESYYAAVKDLDNDLKASFFDTLFQYALYNIEPTDDISPVVKALFLMAKPNLDSSKAKREAGKQGGSKAKQSGSRTKANASKAKQSGSDKEKEKEKDKEIIGGRFTKPSLQEVIDYSKAYSTEKNLVRINEQSWMDYQLANGWKLSNGNAMKDWKASVRTWYSKQPVNSVQQQQGRRYV